MKKLSILYLGVLLLASACDGFLEEKPKDEVASTQYFARPEHARDAVNALYRTGAMQFYEANGSYSGARIMFGPYLSGFVDNEYKGQEVHVQRGQNMTHDGLNLSSYFNSMWSDIYAGISRANNAIKYIPETPGLSEDQINQYMAEARFFRAFNYFYLVRMFGAVPLITEPYESLENLFLERTPARQVYALITEDLESAIASGGLSDVSMINNSSRITKSVAQTVLAEAYLTMSGAAVGEDNYAKSAAAAREIVNSGNYSLVQHSRDGSGEIIANGSAYNKIKDREQVPGEFIYFYEYEIGIVNNIYPSWSYPSNISPLLAYAIANNAYGPTQSLIASYHPGEDLRVQEKQYFHSFIELDGEVIEFQRAPYMWEDQEAAYETALSDKDMPIYTLANVLLIGAEAIAMSEGVTTEAVDYLAQIRERALWKKSSAEIRSELSGLSVDQFVEEVWKERVRELVFEFPIWFDVMRTRKFPKPTNDGTGEIEFVDAVGATNFFNGAIKEQNMLFPLPEQELQRNPSLTQNPGYAN
ncbi:RagB/SusD family nutrient uptake outer membrane protein [Algoriphagus sp. AGSA1]|uniref:RagB/SusD family nutrient uptake outer membrane protein n=1 Tax=Algoriphagus sp. AGSA1 TaxID=2907213 RepID=UPI001F2D4EEF|nr:RagB/SusD family nutrient uptake outer membrane protein [Algoriphagus sp. AGSA1]MCE7055251.1 RagB/SusD family nutrient uptake outer membrane protein [Algoriphagus sp. AGSA1]